MTQSAVLSVVHSLSQVDASAWNALAGAEPFLRHEFLSALHETGCATAETGWTPVYLLLHRDASLGGAVPLYLKSHSRGEYVFDYAWADAYERHGLRYYPKLVSAIPFTPVSGARLLAHNDADRALLARGLIALGRQFGLSSVHVLFPNEGDRSVLRDAGFMLREGVQFHWENAGYADWAEYLASFSHDKRKKLRQDRKKVQAAGVTFRWVESTDIDPSTLAFFYRCYCETYYAHGNAPYLNEAFFQRLRWELPHCVVIILALRGDQPVAAALNIRGNQTLYGRYWGAIEYIPGLHFETCYLQSIEYCIQHRIGRFEGGAQGEHKMARGLLPTPTWSAHWVRDAQFAGAIDDFLQRETRAMDDYLQELTLRTPYRRDEQ
ncbi:GNAT family N-acetyltransferase [Bordetella sp. 15P40C-2]|uniref:GNAT family N-acetyltransferase n=1 Tax=Bordetella sp. 15P40C-2 TaxID=2572246 RepID=UPI0013206500|nr:GNAT family N-acetyltransferase [Bordetella sp. 15P40C-2]MVW70697.1 GNAT family N-acetyltransferase [Bordetella sp. 15P40C-2]